MCERITLKSVLHSYDCSLRLLLISLISQRRSERVYNSVLRDNCCQAGIKRHPDEHRCRGAVCICWYIASPPNQHRFSQNQMHRETLASTHAHPLGSVIGAVELWCIFGLYNPHRSPIQKKKKKKPKNIPLFIFECLCATCPRISLSSY